MMTEASPRRKVRRRGTTLSREVIVGVEGRVVAVTGASGFLGSHVAAALASAGWTVRGLVRRPRASRFLEGFGVVPVFADLLDPHGLAEALEGADAVVGNAAIYTIRRQPWEAFAAPNVEGTANLVAASARAGVGRVVHVSSTAVYRTPAGWDVPEDAPRWGAQDKGRARNYAISKAVSEDMAWSVAASHDLPLTVVRPCSIYGSRDRQLMPTLARLRRWPVLPVPDRVQPFVHADDVAAAIVAALDAPSAAGRAYNLAGEAVRLSTFLRTWTRVSGSGPILVPVPLPGGVSYDTTAAARDLGFHARPLEEGLREALVGGWSPSTR